MAKVWGFIPDEKYGDVVLVKAPSLDAASAALKNKHPEFEIAGYFEADGAFPNAEETEILVAKRKNMGTY